MEPRYFHGAARLRRPARPDLVRPHGAARRDAGQSVLHRRRHRRRKGGALPRQGADQPRHSRGHQAFRHLGAAVVAFLYSAWGRMGQGLVRRRADDPCAAAGLPLSRQRLFDFRPGSGAGADRLPVDATRARRQIAAGWGHWRGRRAGVASHLSRQRLDDQRIVRGRAGRAPRRGDRARRSAD